MGDYASYLKYGPIALDLPNEKQNTQVTNLNTPALKHLEKNYKKKKMYEEYKTKQKYYFLTPDGYSTEELFFETEIPGVPGEKYLFKDRFGKEVRKSDNDQAWYRFGGFGFNSASSFTNLGGKMRRRMRRTNKKSHKKSHNKTQKKSNKKSHKKTRKNKY
jgi:hypothetical protein